jgi:deoxyribonuclease-4
MLKIGCHLSTSKGYEAMGKDALKIGANVFQFFTRNPRGSKAKDIDPNDVEKLIDIMKENNFGKLLAHAPYTLNPCSGKSETREFAKMVMEDDLNRMEYLPHNYYNFHPGSHVKQGVETGIEYIINALNDVIKEEQTTIVLLETMAGKGTEIGRTFEELKQIIEGVHLADKIGVCLDTCHVYDAGYDIVNNLDGVLDEFDKIIGLNRLYAIHLNDSKNPFSSKKDRHETIGNGQIGIDAIDRIINHPKLRNLPFILETPNELDGHEREIKLLKGLVPGTIK